MLERSFTNHDRVGTTLPEGHMSTLKEGEQAPPFRLPADDGSEVSLEGLRGQYVVLYFFPKALTPG